MVSFLAKVKFFRFWPRIMDYNPWFDFWESEKRFEKSIPSSSTQKEKSNDVCFSCIAPSSGEL